MTPYFFSWELNPCISIWFALVNISTAKIVSKKSVLGGSMTVHSILCPSSACRCACSCASLQVTGLWGHSWGLCPSPKHMRCSHRSNISGLRAGRRSEPILSVSVLKPTSCICTSADLATERSNLLQALASNTLLMGSLWQQGQLSADNLRLHSFAEWKPSWVNSSTVYLGKMKIRWNCWGFWQVEQFFPTRSRHSEFESVFLKYNKGTQLIWRSHYQFLNFHWDTINNALQAY